MAPDHTSDKDEKDTGATRDGRSAIEMKSSPAKSLRKKRRFNPPLSLDDLEPVSAPPPKLSISPQRRKSSPGFLFSPMKTPVADDIKNLWQKLELQASPVPKCDDTAPVAFSFKPDEIVADTVIKTGSGELTPHNRVTLDGLSLGIAARGPKDSVQAEIIFNTALQNDCGAIVNLATPLEGMVANYLPEPGQKSIFGHVTVERLVDESDSKDESRALFSLKPVHANIRVKSKDSIKELVFHWEPGMLNHVSAEPRVLVNISNSLPEDPILFHCQKGIGRTAMVMLVHAIRIKKQQGVSKDQAIATLVRMINDGRRCRGQFLENDRQLQSVLKAVALLYEMTEEELVSAVKSV